MSHAASFFCYPLVGGWLRYQDGSRVAGAFRRSYYDGLYPRTKPRRQKCTQPGGFVDGIEDRLLSALLIICSPAFVVRLRFKEFLTSTCRSRRIPMAR